MTPIFAVAKIGKDARSADPNDFIFHSSYNTFKIIKEATKTITLAASTPNQTFSDAHGVDFIPFATAFANKDGVNQVFLPNSGNIDLWGSKLGWTSDINFNYVSSDATNVNFNFDNGNGSTVVIHIRYFILENVGI